MHIEQQISSTFGKEIFSPGFERVKGIFEDFHRYFGPEQIITIAGTNGKGETALSVEYLLLREGKKVAVWTSPHIHHIRERFRFNGMYIDEDVFEQTCLELMPYLHGSLSYYEFLFYVFCTFCSQKKPDYIVLEVGLGGRLDAVNVFDAKYAAITSIGLDHQELLGDSEVEILKEKWGVTRRMQYIFSGVQQPDLVDLIKQKSEKLSARLFQIKEHKNDYSLRNRHLAVKICECVLGHKISGRAIESLEKKVFQGRMEKWKSGQVRFTFNGAHNIDGIEALVEKIKFEKLKFDQIIVSFSDRDFSQIKRMLDTLLRYTQNNVIISLCHFEHNRAIDINKLNLLRDIYSAKNNVELYLDFNSAVKGKNILVTGSYYFIAEAQKCIGF
ncbi:MAG: hypothetical protein H6622_05050 [Halobacteriovoraceae bacterium]|nr:hypothetical protein [Halobacteriovoraceae bacterium]